MHRTEAESPEHDKHYNSINLIQITSCSMMNDPNSMQQIRHQSLMQLDASVGGWVDVNGLKTSYIDLPCLQFCN